MELYTSELGEAFSILSKFNLSNAIEADIVRNMYLITYQRMHWNTILSLKR